MIFAPETRSSHGLEVIDQKRRRLGLKSLVDAHSDSTRYTVEKPRYVFIDAEPAADEGSVSHR